MAWIQSGWVASDWKFQFRFIFFSLNFWEVCFFCTLMASGQKFQIRFFGPCSNTLGLHLKFNLDRVVLVRTFPSLIQQEGMVLKHWTSEELFFKDSVDKAYFVYIHEQESMANLSISLNCGSTAAKSTWWERLLCGRRWTPNVVEARTGPGRMPNAPGAAQIDRWGHRDGGHQRDPHYRGTKERQPWGKKLN